MAVRKATRSNPPAQPTPQHAKTARTAIPDRAKAARSGSPGAGGPAPKRPNHQRKAEFFDALHHLNRGYGIALSALERLETKDRQQRPSIFPSGYLRDYRNRTQVLRAVANRDLLRLLAGHEDRDATRFSRPNKSRS